jgi:hypothetical protein
MSAISHKVTIYNLRVNHKLYATLRFLYLGRYISPRFSDFPRIPLKLYFNPASKVNQNRQWCFC